MVREIVERILIRILLLYQRSDSVAPSVLANKSRSN